MSITFYSGRLIGDTWHHVGEEDDEANLSNHNACLVFEALGIEAEPCGEIEIEKAIGLMRSWLRANFNKPSPGEEMSVQGGDGRCTVISFGVSEGYLNRRIHQLSVLAARCKEKGATHVCWA
jgi:hypothetical protein